MGLEPTTFGTTIRRSNRLSYNLRLKVAQRYMTVSQIAKPKNSSKCEKVSVALVQAVS